MLLTNKNDLKEKMNTFLDILNFSGEVNIEWMLSKKEKFDNLYINTNNCLDLYKRGKGKLLRQLDSNNILLPENPDEYDMEDIKGMIYNSSVTDSVNIFKLDKLVNRLINLEDRINLNYKMMNHILTEVANKKGIDNVHKLEPDTFNEHYYDIDIERKERGIVLLKASNPKFKSVKTMNKVKKRA